MGELSFDCFVGKINLGFTWAVSRVPGGESKRGVWAVESVRQGRSVLEWRSKLRSDVDLLCTCGVPGFPCRASKSDVWSRSGGSGPVGSRSVVVESLPSGSLGTEIDLIKIGSAIGSGILEGRNDLDLKRTHFSQ